MREDTDLVYRRYAGAPSYDVSVPLSEIEAYLDRCLAGLKEVDASFDPFVFGHLADGNLHIVLNAAGREIPGEKARAAETVLYRDIAAIGGSFSAEHGIGLKRVESLSDISNPAKPALMRRVKDALDGAVLLNPGKALDTGANLDRRPAMRDRVMTAQPPDQAAKPPR